MYPVLAQEEIQIAEMNRQRRLAAAERKRLNQTPANASGINGLTAASLRGLWDGLSSTVGTLARFRGAGGAPVPDESVAIPSA